MSYTLSTKAVCEYGQLSDDSYLLNKKEIKKKLELNDSFQVSS